MRAVVLSLIAFVVRAVEFTPASHVIFDFDGLLVDSVKVYADVRLVFSYFRNLVFQVNNRFLEQFGLQLTPELEQGWLMRNASFHGFHQVWLVDPQGKPFLGSSTRLISPTE